MSLINLTINNSSNTSKVIRVIEQPQELPQILLIITLIVCLAVITLGVFGNALVFIILGVKRSNLKSCEIFMLNLAVADFLNATIAPVRTALDLIHVNLYSIGHEGCKAISFLSTTTMTVSALTLLTVSIDRFIVVKWPLSERPHLRTFLLVIFTWFAAAGLGLFYLTGGNIQLGVYKADVYTCFNYMTFRDFIIYSISVFSIQCVIPIIVMTTIYSMIIMELKKSAKSGIFAHCKREMQLRLLQNKKATKMIFVVVLVFYFCILPANIFYIWYIFNQKVLELLTVKIIYDILVLLQMCNSIVNPIIYSRLHNSFKKDIVKLIFPCFYNKIEKWESMQDTIRLVLRYSSIYRKRSNSKSSIGSSSIKTRTSITSLQHQLPSIKRRFIYEVEPRKFSGVLENLYSAGSPVSLETTFFGDNVGHDLVNSCLINRINKDQNQKENGRQYPITNQKHIM
ncbi:neuropeptide Y receptor type 6 isoform X1 [Hydra vulgaris]